MKKFVITMMSIICFSSFAYADNFRCPNGAIVSTGDSISMVSIKCDPPSFKNTRMETTSGTQGATIVINVEEWTYNEGPNKLVHLLVFRNGKLEEVQSLGYGK